MDLSYSVLMPVYHKERAEYLKLSIDSMMTQTVRPSDFVIVCDGPLNDSLDQVLSDCQASNPSVIQIVRLPQSAGVGPALNVGLDYCKHGLIARMDSDDIAVPNRIALQLQAFCDTPSLALCGGQIAEFMDNPSQICSRRVVPCEHKQIYQYAKKRNPMNHMTVMFRKTAVADAGGYQKMDFAEDYYLWARMLVKGYLAQNISQS